MCYFGVWLTFAAFQNLKVLSFGIKMGVFDSVVGPEKVMSVTSELGIDNRDIYNNILKLQKTEFDAAMQTPAAKIRLKLGYGNVVFNPVTRIISGRRK